jgi:hypothetical protein
MTNNERLAGVGGMTIEDGTTDLTNQNIEYLIPREDTVIANLEASDPDGSASVDMLSTWNWDGTLKSTDFLLPPTGWTITRLKLTSGSVQIFKK